jgi:hypothetical protein
MEIYRRMNMALYHYSTDPHAPTTQHQGTKFVPFTAFAKVVPSHKQGKRGVYVRDLQKIASFIETDLAATELFTLANPVAFTPQIGQNPARVTIYGFIDIDRRISPNAPPTSFPHVIHSGTDPGEGTAVYAGPTGGSTSWGQDVKTRIDEEVFWLKSNLEAASEWLNDIFYIEYNGVKYGSEWKRRFRSFPIS